MTTNGSTTRLIHDLEIGRDREQAAFALWDRFFDDLVRHALKKLHTMHISRRTADEEDAASRAFTKVCRGIESGQLQLESRIDLRKLLLKATEREVINHYHRQNRGGNFQDEAFLLESVPATQRTPILALLAQEGCRQLLDALEDDEQRRIALLKLVGYTNQEIAGRLNCSLAKVERKLVRIRSCWDKVAPIGTAQPGRRDASAGAGVEDPGDTTTILCGHA